MTECYNPRCSIVKPLEDLNKVFGNIYLCDLCFEKLQKEKLQKEFTKEVLDTFFSNIRNNSDIDEYKYRILTAKRPKMLGGTIYDFNCCPHPEVYEYPKTDKIICETCGFDWTRRLAIQERGLND